MKILRDLIEASRQKDHPVTEVLTGAYWTGVTSRHCGLDSTFRDEGHPHARGVKDLGRLTEKSSWDLAHYALSDYAMEASIGMAALNSMIAVEEENVVEKNAAEILLEKGAGKNIAIVGHFPFIPALQWVARTLWVLEQRQKEGDLPAEKAEEILPQSDVVGITGTAFITQTLDDLLKWAAGKFIVLIGPTTPLTPLLFEYGVQVLSGTQVVDPEETFRCISQGATFREVRGIRRVTMVKK
jgi:uncharacterized protein (DUF4213/DUF364 family)